jgi:Flp pilus assembly protein TadB
MILLAALAGAAIAAGIVLAVRGLVGRVPDPGRPPSLAAKGAPSRATRNRILIALLAGLVVFVLTRWPVGGLVAAAAVIFLPRLGLGNSAQKRTAMLEGLEQWIRRLSDMVTASRGLEDAIEASARSAPASVAEPVNALATRLASRTGAEAALRAFAAEIDDPAGDRIAAALIIATGRRGGGARDVLMALAVLLTRDVAARRDIEAERAQHRTTIRWICLFVAGFTIFTVLNRSYSAPFSTAAGQVVLALVAGLYAAGLFWLNRLGSIPSAGRFLDDADPGGGPGLPASAQLTEGTGARSGGSR